jgi:hypothetical protein
MKKSSTAPTGDAPLFDVPEFCEAHRICRATLYGLWREGLGPARVKIGRRTLIPRTAANEWLDKLAREA